MTHHRLRACACLDMPASACVHLCCRPSAPSAPPSARDRRRVSRVTLRRGRIAFGHIALPCAVLALFRSTGPACSIWRARRGLLTILLTVVLLVLRKHAPTTCPTTRKPCACLDQVRFRLHFPPARAGLPDTAQSCVVWHSQEFSLHDGMEKRRIGPLPSVIALHVQK